MSKNLELIRQAVRSLLKQLANAAIETDGRPELSGLGVTRRRPSRRRRVVKRYALVSAA